MAPRGKTRAKREAEENGSERKVRESRNVKTASYKDLSDSEDDKPVKKRKQESESEEEPLSEEEKPKKRVSKARGGGRSRKDDSDSDEVSDFASSDESSAGESSRRRRTARKPVRSLRAQRETSYKDLSDSEEESGSGSGSGSGSESPEDSSEKEEKSPVKEDKSGDKRKRGRPPKASGKSEPKNSGESDKDSEADEPSSEHNDDAEESNGTKGKGESSDKEGSSKSGDSKSRPDHALSEEEASEEEVSEDDAPKKKEIDPKKRSRPEKDDGANKKPPAKKAKVESKPKLNKTDTQFESLDFSSEAKTKDGEKWNLKISSWNVAGLRTLIMKGGLDFVKYENPDILCLQETKCSEKKLPPEAKVEGYHSYWCSGEKEGYAGVAILSKEKPLNVEFGIGNPEFDCEGRVITAEYEKFFVVNVYVPNAGQGLKTLPKRMEWDPIFRAFLKKLDEKKPVILCGDMNVSHLEIDLANPKTNTKSAGFTPQEREGMTALLGEGFVDTFRKLYPDKTGAYSFWTYFKNARSRNIGWRLDYFITSERFLPHVCDNVMRSEVYGSDHCPITFFAHV